MEVELETVLLGRLEFEGTRLRGRIRLVGLVVVGLVDPGLGALEVVAVLVEAVETFVVGVGLGLRVAVVAIAGLGDVAHGRLVATRLDEVRRGSISVLVEVAVELRGLEALVRLAVAVVVRAVADLVCEPGDASVLLVAVIHTDHAIVVGVRALLNLRLGCRRRRGRRRRHRGHRLLTLHRRGKLLAPRCHERYGTEHRQSRQTRNRGLHDRTPCICPFLGLVNTHAE